MEHSGTMSKCITLDIEIYVAEVARVGDDFLENSDHSFQEFTIIKQDGKCLARIGSDHQFLDSFFPLYLLIPRINGKGTNSSYNEPKQNRRHRSKGQKEQPNNYGGNAPSRELGRYDGVGGNQGDATELNDSVFEFHAVAMDFE